MDRSRRRVVAALLLAGGAAPRAQDLNEARVKARLALTLARFTQWPASAFATPQEPLQLCVLHRSEPVGAAFGELAGQTVAGRPVRVLAAPPATLAGCHVLFAHASAGAEAERALALAAGLPVLTVGDADGFAGRGGMVELVNLNDAIRLDVDLGTLRAARLELSSRVLQLARRVRE